MAPALDGRAVDGLTHLPLAECSYRAGGVVEIQAARVPGQADVPDHGTAPALRIFDQLLVGHIQYHPFRQGTSPMIHDASIFAVVVSQILEIVGIRMGGSEILEING